MSPRDAVLTLDSPSYFPQQCESRARHDLLSPRLESSDGSGPAINVGDLRGKLAVVSMMINHVAEHEWLALSVWGSIDGEDWGTTPLATLPRKGYCGVYATFLDLARHPEVRYLQVRWTMGRWGYRDNSPVFGFSVKAEEAAA